MEPYIVEIFLVLEPGKTIYMLGKIIRGSKCSTVCKKFKKI